MQISGRLKRSVGAINDLVATAVAFIAANYLVLLLTDLPITPGLYEKTVYFSVVATIFYYIFELNRGSWRYASVPDLIAILKAVTLSVSTYVFIIFMYSRGKGISQLAPVLLWFILIMLLAGPRIGYRIMRERGWRGLLSERVKSRPNAKSVLVYRVSTASDAYVRAVNARPDANIYIAGLIDDKAIKGSRTIQGQKILGGLKDVSKIVASLKQNFGIHVTDLLVSGDDFKNRSLIDILEYSGNAGLRICRIPDIVETLNHNLSNSLEPKPVEISELLNRNEIKYNLIEITRFIEGKTVLITGAGGTIGAELSRHIVNFNPRCIVLIDISEYFLYMIDTELRDTFPNVKIITRIADIRDEKRIDSLFAAYKPDIVFHAAAIKHVPLAEQNVVESIKTNVIGTRNCARAAVKHEVSVFVLISTDKAVNPTNVMGATKRAAEAYCQALDMEANATRFKTVRFGNVLGSNGSVVPRFAAQIAKGGPVTVTHSNVVRYFMTISEAALLVLKASAMGVRESEERGKILVLDMGEPVRITDLAERMIRLAGHRPNIDIKIEYIGLRPGEKLIEELFDAREVQQGNRKGSHLVASPRNIDLSTMEKIFDSMMAAVDRQDGHSALAKLQIAVPEFHARSSLDPSETTPALLNAKSASIIPLTKPEKAKGARETNDRTDS